MSTNIPANDNNIDSGDINDRTKVLNQWSWSSINNWVLIIPKLLNSTWGKIKKTIKLSSFEWGQMTFWTNPNT